MKPVQRRKNVVWKAVQEDQRRDWNWKGLGREVCRDSLSL